MVSRFKISLVFGPSEEQVRGKKSLLTLLVSIFDLLIAILVVSRYKLEF